MTRSLRIEVWSDVACPWCWVGKRHLEQALEGFDGEVEVRWRAFELDPSASRSPRTDIDYVDRLARKYMASRDQAQQMIDRMVEVGATRGLDFRFDRVQPGNTFDAHRLLAWASGQGAELQDRFKERLFAAYMNEGKRVWDHDTLVELAGDVGLDAEQARAILASDEYGDEVRAEEARAGELAVTGVPFFVIDGRVALQGAQPPELLRKAVDKAVELRAVEVETEADSVPGDACGPDGCAI